MAVIRVGVLTRSLAALCEAGSSAGLADAELLERIAIGRDEASRSAFEVIVARHGRMVLEVCRRALDDPHDAQDAFQATFLVLARRAGSIRRGDALASWLFGVSRRVCARARAEVARRRVHERRAAERMARPGRADDGCDHAAVHEEIARLPERYRLPVVLCYLEGLTYQAAADRLGCPLGTIGVRLGRARDRLRSGLRRRGLSAPAGLMAVAPTIPPGVPAGLAEGATRLALRFVDHGAAVGGASPPHAVDLARGVLGTMRTTTTVKAMMIGCGLVVAAGLGGLAWSEAGPVESPRDQARPKIARQAPPPPAGDLGRLQGTWISVDPARNNKRIASQTWEIQGATLIDRTRDIGGVEQENRSEIRLDERAAPRGIDLVQKSTPVSREGVRGEEREAVVRGLYKIEGETLTLCGRRGIDQPRPAGFPGAGGDDSLLVLAFRRGRPPGPAVAPGAPVVPPGGDLGRLQGTWAADRLGPGREIQVTVTIAGDVMTTTTDTPRSTMRRSDTLTLDEGTRPRSLDLKSGGAEPWKILGIYDLDGDTLTLRFGPPDGSRPTDLKAEGPDPLSLLTLKRRPIP